MQVFIVNIYDEFTFSQNRIFIPVKQPEISLFRVVNIKEKHAASWLAKKP